MGCRAVWIANSLPRTGQQIEFFPGRISPPHSCSEHELGDGKGSRKNSSSLPSRNCTGNKRLGTCKMGFAGTAMQDGGRIHILQGREDHWKDPRSPVRSVFFRVNPDNLEREKKKKENCIKIYGDFMAAPTHLVPALAASSFPDHQLHAVLALLRGGDPNPNPQTYLLSEGTFPGHFLPSQQIFLTVDCMDPLTPWISN